MTALLQLPHTRAQHLEHPTQCLLCNASFFCTQNGRHACPAHSLSTDFASELADCVCVPGFNRSAPATCALGRPPMYYAAGVARACPAHKATVRDGAGALADCVCRPGFEHGTHFQNACAKCRAGTYADAFNTSLCAACPAHSTHLELRATSVTACTCEPGFTGPDGGPCAACAAGSFKPLNGSQACGLCPADAFSGAAAAACQACHANSSAPAGSDDVGDCACDAGFEPFEGLCRACRPGKFKGGGGNAACALCGDGRYTDAHGATACAQCAGNSTPVTDHTKCACDPGYRQPGLGDVRPECSPCAAGRYQHVAGQTACEACPAHATSDPASDHLADCTCVAGFVETDALSGACAACAAGKHEVLGAGAGLEDERSSCQDCPSASHSPPAAAAVSGCICNAGFDGPDGGPCAACAAGTFKAANGSAACADCPADTFSDGPAFTACTDCVAFALAPAGSDAEDDCACDVDRGYSTIFSDAGRRECTPCAAGTFVAPDDGCRNCSEGFFSNVAGLTACAECAANTTSTLQLGGHVECVCEAGFSCRGVDSCDGACVACPRDTFKEAVAYAPACDACLPHSQSPPASESRAACRCNAGYSGPDGGNCSACAGGTFADAVGEPACEQCPPWHFTPAQLQPLDSAADCRPCENCSLAEYDSARAGRGCGEFAPSACAACPAHSAQFAANAYGGRTGLGVASCSCNSGFHGALGGACTLCPAGTVKTQRLAVDSAETDCAACAPGTYARAAAEACVDCGARATSRAGAAACFCNAGYTGPTAGDGSGCEGCAAGSFKNSTGPHACAPCAADTFAAAAAAACAACAPHSGAPAGSSFCLCDVGFTGSDGDGQACRLCADGTFKTAVGAEACTNCSACGEQQQVATECSAAADITCAACQANSHADRRVRTGPCLCNVGYELHQAAPGGAGECEACAPGTFKATDLNNSAACRACPPLSFAPAPAAGQCQACAALCADADDSAEPPLRFFVAAECNATRDIVCRPCTVCPAGFYANHTCGAHFHGDRRDTECAPCPPGSYCPGGDAGVLPCPPSADSGAQSSQRGDCSCRPGFFNSDGAGVAADLSTTAVCRACDPDTYCLGDGAPRACPQFAFTRRAASARRLDCHCLNGHYRLGADDAFVCPLCRENDFCFNNSQFNCSDPRMVSAVGSDAHEDCVCLPGLYNNGSRCEPCPVDAFCPGDKRALACPAHEWTAGRAGQARCVCRPRFFRSLIDGLDSSSQPAAACRPCLADRFCPGDADAILACPANASAPAALAARVTDCACDPGFQNATTFNATLPASHACRECPHKTFKAHGGNEQCAPCFVCLPADGVFELQACRAAHDSMCSPCDACTGRQHHGGEFTALPCALTADAECENCTACDYSRQFLGTQCTPQQDAVCLNVSFDRACAVGLYAGGHTPREDSRCLPCRYRDAPYLGATLHVPASSGAAYDDAYSCRVQCLGNSVLRDPRNLSLGCRTCENGNILLRNVELDPAQRQCRFSCRAGYALDPALGDCVVPPLQASARTTLAHAISVVAFEYTAAGFRFRVQHTNHSRFVIAVGPYAVDSAQCVGAAGGAGLGCCWAGQLRVSELAQAAAAGDTCSAQPGLAHRALRGDLLEFDIPEVDVGRAAACAFAGSSYDCTLHLNLVDVVLQRAVTTSVRLSSRRGDLTTTVSRTRYIPLSAFDVRALKAYEEDGTDVFLVSVHVEAPAAINVSIRAPALTAVNGTRAQARCPRLTAASRLAGTVALQPNVPVGFATFWRATPGTERLTFLFNLDDGDTFMDIGAVRNVSGQTAACAHAETTVTTARHPARYEFALGVVTAATGLGASAMQALRVHTTHGALGALVTFIAYAHGPEVLHVTLRSVLGAHAAPPDVAAFRARTANATALEQGELHFAFAFREWCRAHACAYGYLHIDARRRGFHTVDCAQAAGRASGRALARAWIVNNLGAVHDDGHVDAACAAAAGLAGGRASAVVLVNTMPYASRDMRLYAERTAAWATFDFQT